VKQLTSLRSAGRQIRVRGMVQGVGFRPNVWRLATQCGIAGRVCNDGEGVLIQAWGAVSALDDFAARLRSEAPPLARIDVIECRAIASDKVPREFSIAQSTGGAVHTAVVPDAPTCTACIADIRNPYDRRWGYGFTNCTHCGPRLSIVRAVPYDRGNTTMSAFAMCERCRSEYENPADRRFHAQPIACADCGPRLWLEDALGAVLAESSVPALQAVRSALRSGRIVAIKGLGGFHLACDALDAAAVAQLRGRKQRYGKPLALMARDLAVVRRYCLVSPKAAALLSSSVAPIVILPIARGQRVAPQVAPGLRSLGFMLPNTPLHHLLLTYFDSPIVLTSGNLSDEPQCTDNQEARRRLKSIADLFLMHDRDIANRVDDSLVQEVAGESRVLRRARGYAPAPLKLPPGFERAPQILAMGAQLKNTFALIKDGEAILSPHIGDLETAAAHADYRRSLDLFAQMFEHRPTAIAVDLHPEYLSSKLGRERALERHLKVINVQHHHAHIAAVLAESGRPLDAPPVLGIALDGLGYGADESLWGGEFLLADYRGFKRLAHLKPVAMIGGERAITQPWRGLYAHLCAALGWERFERDYAQLDAYRLLAGKPRVSLDSMQAAGINSPLASSCGRLFDAVAAALGVCFEEAGYEAQPAIELEALAEGASLAPTDLGYPFTISHAADSGVELDPAPMWHALLADLAGQTDLASVAMRFHRGLARALAQTVRELSSGSEAMSFDTVALSGGVFQNSLLFEAVRAELGACGYVVLTHRQVPCHDGGLSLGQAAIAAAQLLQPAPSARRSLVCA
jgi:hydrogenase maturation protein HypF